MGLLGSVMQEDKLVYYLDKSSVGPQSCVGVKPVCLAGAGLPYVDATVAHSGSAADRQGSWKDCC